MNYNGAFSHWQLVMAIGHRTNALNVDLKEILPEELESEVKEAAEISMGSEVNQPYTA